MKIGEQKRKIKIKAFDGRLKIEEQEFIAKEISKLV